MIYENGKVVSQNNDVICTSGGQTCLQQYFDQVFNVTPAVTRDIVYINGELYYIYSNFTITDANGVFILNGTVTDLITLIDFQKCDPVNQTTTEPVSIYTDGSTDFILFANRRLFDNTE